MVLFFYMSRQTGNRQLWEGMSVPGSSNFPLYIKPVPRNTHTSLDFTQKSLEAFDALVAAMRDMKRRYFCPPLQDSDYIALGLKPHDNTQRRAGQPLVQALIPALIYSRLNKSVLP
jgi:hypothetical protein